MPTPTAGKFSVQLFTDPVAAALCLGATSGCAARRQFDQIRSKRTTGDGDFAATAAPWASSLCVVEKSLRQSQLPRAHDLALRGGVGNMDGDRPEG
jgi:hypothetical protein